VNLAGRTIVSAGCSTGREPLARAFRESCCRAYIGPVEDADQDAGALFIIGFFIQPLSRD
jgi:hypothetical protein